MSGAGQVHRGSREGLMSCATPRPELLPAVVSTMSLHRQSRRFELALGAFIYTFGPWRAAKPVWRPPKRIETPDAAPVAVYYRPPHVDQDRIVTMKVQSW